MKNEETKKIFCIECQCNTQAILITGSEIYSHRDDLKDLPFWKCRDCENFVGCHHKTSDRTKPLGCIPNKEMKLLRREIHKNLDSLWTSNEERKKIYKIIQKEMGYGNHNTDPTRKSYHTGELRTISDAKKVLQIIEAIK